MSTPRQPERQQRAPDRSPDSLQTRENFRREMEGMLSHRPEYERMEATIKAKKDEIKDHFNDLNKDRRDYAPEGQIIRIRLLDALMRPLIHTVRDKWIEAINNHVRNSTEPFNRDQEFGEYTDAITKAIKGYIDTISRGGVKKEDLEKIIGDETKGYQRFLKIMELFKNGLGEDMEEAFLLTLGMPSEEGGSMEGTWDRVKPVLLEKLKTNPSSELMEILWFMLGMMNYNYRQELVKEYLDDLPMGIEITDYANIDDALYERLKSTEGFIFLQEGNSKGVLNLSEIENLMRYYIGDREEEFEFKKDDKELFSITWEELNDFKEEARRFIQTSIGARNSINEHFSFANIASWLAIISGAGGMILSGAGGLFRAIKEKDPNQFFSSFKKTSYCST